MLDNVTLQDIVLSSSLVQKVVNEYLIHGNIKEILGSFRKD